MAYNKSPRVGVVILTYNRLNLLEIALCKVKNQSYTNMQILVVDNDSTDGTRAYLSAQKNINTLFLDFNTGPAGGFYYGIKYFKEKEEIDYLWLMDDDFFPARTCLENLLHTASSKVVLFPFVRNKDFQTKNNPAWWGVLLPVGVVNKIGLPDKELFFWGEDTEYLKYRIEEVHQIPCKWVSSAKGVHFATRGKNSRSAWRYYYEARNNIYIRLYVRKNKLNLPQRLYKAFKFWLFLLGGLLFKENEKFIKLKLFILGTFHGVTKKLGKTIDPSDY
ncbi:hypothetical protein SAMN05660776_0760 [Salegentibacter holothuriorum]|uniref:Glycosyltransferase 2-like domain-containing protein n=1 Tax=Salegentibacter holothuriorum TaxID=241145 RepID=A0A1T5APA4_9FLAO|nr:glycosyltransferase [Salegentibacter holothuriorum]SKB36822.1 hypothetical protein SAMN05660776_0760 [Salegentibacter holothuriorum]